MGNKSVSAFFVLKMATVKEIYNLHNSYTDKDELNRRERQRKQFFYYAGHENEVISYLENALCESFGDSFIERYQPNYINFLELIINSLAIVYKEPASRKIVLPGEDDESKKVTDLNEYYKRIQPLNANTLDKKAHRFAKLFDNSWTQVVFDKTIGRFRYEVEQNNKLTVLPDDNNPLKASAIAYTKKFEGKEYTVIWTPEEHLKMDSNKNRFAIGDNGGMVNPYQMITFNNLLLSSTNEGIWGNGQEDLVNASEQVNVLLTFYVNRSIFQGTQGTLFSYNLNIEGKGKKDAPVELRQGYAHPVHVKGVKRDEMPPDMKYVSFEPYLDQIRESVDWMIKTSASLKGLNPNDILSQIKDTSDYQKMMDAVGKMEVRRDDVEPCRVYEKERFETLKTINNVEARGAQGKEFNLMEIPEDAELHIDFVEPEVIKTPEDEQKENEFNYKHNLSTPALTLMEKNPDRYKTIEDAESQILKNKEFNRTLQGSSLGSLFNINNQSQAG